MTTTKCAACKNRVEEGAVRCPNCNASLVRPGAFLQTLGYVVVAVAAVPFAIGLVAMQEGSFLPEIFGAVIFIAGIVMIAAASAKNRGAPPAVIEEESPETSLVP
jgi:cyanate permease